MLETDIKKLNSHFNQPLSFLHIVLFVKAFLFDKNDLILSLINLKKHSNCSIFEIIKVFNLPSDLQDLILGYSFQPNCKHLFIQIVKDSLNKNNFSNTFTLNLNKRQRIELSLFYNQKFYNK